MTFMDFHTHNLDADWPAVIQVPTEVLLHPDGWEPVAEAVYSVGIHPWSVTADAPLGRLFEGFDLLSRRPEVVAVGECGLDRLRGDYVRQEEVFVYQARQAERLGKPVILHCVRALSEMLRLHKSLRPRTKWTLHGFRGGPAAARQALAAGLDLSFGQHFNPAAVAACPPDRMHIETDDCGLPLADIEKVLAPYLRPHGGDSV